MADEWKQLYEDALREQAPQQVHATCARARHAINARLLALAKHGGGTSQTIEEMEEALRRLAIHELS